MGLGDRQRTEWCDPVRSRRVTCSWTVNAATLGLYLAAGDFSGGFPPTSCGTARAGIHRADQRLRMRMFLGALATRASCSSIRRAEPRVSGMHASQRCGQPGSVGGSGSAPDPLRFELHQRGAAGASL